jgi:ubiquitin C-terminal hydrolase
MSSTGESGGHYICDVRENISNVWFKTNDDSDPIQIRNPEVSQYAYVVMYKRVE